MQNYQEVINRIVLAMATVMAMSCGAGNSGGVENTANKAPKSLFSIWVADNQSLVIDMRSQAIGATGVVPVTSSYGSICNVTMNLTGTTTNAVGNATAASYVPMTGNGNPDCSIYSGYYHATITNDKMRLCDPPTWVNCQNYH